MNAQNADRLKLRALREAHEWRFRMSAPDCTPAVKRAFEEWRALNPIHADMFERAQSDYNALGELTRADIDSDLLQPIPVERNKHAVRTALGTLRGIRAKWKPAALRGQ